MISIVTATYNREKLLKRLYNSLCKQESKLFEWIVIDDGSIDNTENLITEFKNENTINIIYLKKVNGGKHTALNLGIELANFPYIFFVDSDDVLPENSIKTIIDKIGKISLRSDYKNLAGICGDKAHLDGQVVGTVLEDEIVCSYIDFRYKYKIIGDKAEIFKTEILKKYKFPVFENEKFCPEGLIWNRISNEYDMYFFSEIVYLCEYQDGGLTDQIYQIRKKSPNATLLYYKELFLIKNISFYFRVRALINFWRFYLVSLKSPIEIEPPQTIMNSLVRNTLKIFFMFKKL